MWRGRRRGTEVGKPWGGGWGAGGGLSPAGMGGLPWGPVGAEAPHVETTTCVSVTEVLRVLPQEFIRCGDCGPGRPRGMTTKRKWGARMSLAVSTSPRPGDGRCPCYSLPPVAVVLWWVVVWLPPNGCLCPVPWVQTPVGGGYEAPGRLVPPHNSPPGAGCPLALAVVGGGAVGAVRGPSALLAARTARIMLQGGAPARTARAGRAAPAGGTGGGSGGRGRWMEGGGGSYRALVGPTTLQSGGAAAGALGAPPRGLRLPPCGFVVGEGRQRPLAAMTHGA